ncbi:hypothetical protein D3C84_898830 [compost metagenome]
MHGENRHQRQEGQAQCRRTREQANDQRQPGEKLSTTCQCRHHVAWGQADAFHPLRRACQAVATEQAEEFLRAMGGENYADDNAQDRQAVASAGKQDFVDQRAHAGSSLGVWLLVAILIKKTCTKIAKNAR